MQPTPTKPIQTKIGGSIDMRGTHLVIGNDAPVTLEGFPTDLTRDLIQTARPRLVLKGELLYPFEERPSFVSYVARGWLKLSTLTSHGEERVLGVRKPSEYLALESIADDEFTSPETVALTDGTLLIWDARELRERFETQPPFTVAIGRLLARATRRDLMSRAVQDSSRVAARLARILYQLAKEQGKAIKDGLTLQLPLTQEELAELITVRRETVSLNFGELEREGVIRRDGRTVLILTTEMEAFLERYGMGLDEKKTR
jgi:CRP-like cAMP-binding protein